MKLETYKIGERNICLKGIGKMFYETGYPISMAIDEARKKGYEVSIMHIADECLKNGWSPKTTYNKLKSEFEDDTEKKSYDIEKLKDFCFADYEKQREMMFDYLFVNQGEADTFFKSSFVN